MKPALTILYWTSVWGTVQKDRKLTECPGIKLSPLVNVRNYCKCSLYLRSFMDQWNCVLSARMCDHFSSFVFFGCRCSYISCCRHKKHRMEICGEKSQSEAILLDVLDAPH